MSPRTPARLSPVIVIAAAAVLSALALKFLAYSFVAIFLIGAAACGWLARHVIRTGLKYLFGNAAVLLVALAAIEAVLCFLQPAIKYAEDGGPLMQKDRDLGYSARPNARVTQKRYDGGHLTYNATYGIDGDGRRRMPAYNARSNEAVLLFGCSLTFGVGVNDSEAFPARLQMAEGNALRVFSFALAGYGPHQLLRQLETHREEAAIHGFRPIAVLFPSIPDHVHRAAGRSTWETGGPHYEPDASGDAHYVGPFAAPARGWELLQRVTRKCKILSVLTERRRWPTSRHDFDRFVAVMAKADRIVRERYGVPLVVVSFWTDHRETALMERRLRERGVMVIPVEQLIPDYRQHEADYEIPRDGHLNPMGNQRFALAVRDWISRSSTRSSRSSPMPPPSPSGR